MRTRLAKHGIHLRFDLDQVLEAFSTAGLSLIFKPTPKAAGNHHSHPDHHAL